MCVSAVCSERRASAAAAAAHCWVFNFIASLLPSSLEGRVVDRICAEWCVCVCACVQPPNGKSVYFDIIVSLACARPPVHNYYDERDGAKNGLQYYILDYSIYANKRGFCDATRACAQKQCVKKSCVLCVCVCLCAHVRTCTRQATRYYYFTRTSYFFPRNARDTKATFNAHTRDTRGAIRAIHVHLSFAGIFTLSSLCVARVYGWDRNTQMSTHTPPTSVADRGRHNKYI